MYAEMNDLLLLISLGRNEHDFEIEDMKRKTNQMLGKIAEVKLKERTIDLRNQMKTSSIEQSTFKTLSPAYSETTAKQSTSKQSPSSTGNIS